MLFIKRHNSGISSIIDLAIFVQPKILCLHSVTLACCHSAGTKYFKNIKGKKPNNLISDSRHIHIRIHKDIFQDPWQCTKFNVETQYVLFRFIYMNERERLWAQHGRLLYCLCMSLAQSREYYCIWKWHL